MFFPGGVSAYGLLFVDVEIDQLLSSWKRAVERMRVAETSFLRTLSVAVSRDDGEVAHAVELDLHNASGSRAR